MTDLRKALGGPEANKDGQHVLRESLSRFFLSFGFLSFMEAQQEEGWLNGLRRFQAFHGLDETVALDRRTREALKWVPCGNFRFQESLVARNRSRGELYQRTSLCSWPFDNGERLLRYAFDSTVDLVADKIFCEEIGNAFGVWSQQCGVKFLEVKASKKHEIVIGWRGANDSDLSLRGGDAIAHADFPGSCWEVTSGLPKPIHFDREEHQWGSGHFSVWSVALHEVGHILGLRDSNDPASVMYNSFNEAEPLRSFTTIDLEILHSLYP